MEEFQAIKELQVKYRADWPAIFGANRSGKIWMFRNWGNTPKNRRIYVQGKNKTIDAIAAEYLRIRPDLGRFFVSNEGAFCTPQFDVSRHFVVFQIA